MESERLIVIIFMALVLVLLGVLIGIDLAKIEDQMLCEFIVY